VRDDIGARGNTSEIGMAVRDGDRTRRHYGCLDRRGGTLMRHFLLLPLSPPPLPRGVATRTTVTQLVPGTGPAQRLSPAQASTSPGTVLVPAIAVPTDAHLLRATPATVQPIALLPRLHPPLGGDNHLGRWNDNHDGRW